MDHKEYKRQLGKKLKEMTKEERRTYNRLSHGGPLELMPRQVSSKAEYRRKRRLMNKDKWFERQGKEYISAASHHSKMRARHEVALTSSLNTGSIADWIRSQEQVCYLCGEATMGIDHVIPLSRGGEHELHNMRLCCVSCNSHKGDNTLEELLSIIPNKKAGLEQTIAELAAKLAQLDVMEGRLERLSLVDV